MSEDDHAVVDGVNQIGRIYGSSSTTSRSGGQTVPAPPPNQGMADTLMEAKVDFKRRYAEVKGGN